MPIDRVGRDTAYLDPAGFSEETVNLDDPLEVAAIAAHRLTFATPDEVASLLTIHREAELRYTWAAHPEDVRQLHRRRAAVVLNARAQAERGELTAGDVDEGLVADDVPPLEDLSVGRPTPPELAAALDGDAELDA